MFLAGAIKPTAAITATNNNKESTFFMAILVFEYDKGRAVLPLGGLIFSLVVIGPKTIFLPGGIAKWYKQRLQCLPLYPVPLE